MIDRHDELRQAVADIGEKLENFIALENEINLVEAQRDTARHKVADLYQELDIARARIAELEAASKWRPIETAPKIDYEEILVLVPCEEGLTHRLAMWDPENGAWTVFSMKWGADPVFWMPLPSAPTAPETSDPSQGA